MTETLVKNRSRWLRGLRPLGCWGCGFEYYRRYGCPLPLFCVVRKRSVPRTDHSSRRIPPCMIYLSVIVNPR